MSDKAIITAAISILLLPLLSYALTFFFGRKLPRKGDFIGVTLMGVALVQALRIFIAFWKIGDPAYRVEKAFTWLDLGGFRLDAGILVDGMTAVMLMVVCIVSFLVHLYSTGYMHGDRRYERFFAFLGFFTFSMLGIVLANNLFFLYVFWELVGLSSYLLIGFFFHKASAASANKKAFLTNRVGDWGFWLGILAFFTATGTLNYFDLFAQVNAGAIKGPLLAWAGVGLFMGCVGKSAQMPLHIWLPDAMEGPTPVSALIHAATMVAAGVYMVARLAPLFGPQAMLVILYVGAVTAFVTATIALVKTDIKRVLAFSTAEPAGLHGHGAGRRRLDQRHVPPDHARHVQGAAVPGRRFGDPRRALAGDARHGRPAQEDADHVLDVPDRDSGHQRRPGHVGLLLEGRHPGFGPGLRHDRRPLPAVHPGHHGGRPDAVLHVPHRVPDLLRQAARPAQVRPRARERLEHGHPADGAGVHDADRGGHPRQDRGQGLVQQVRGAVRHGGDLPAVRGAARRRLRGARG